MALTAVVLTETVTFVVALDEDEVDMNNDDARKRKNIWGIIMESGARPKVDTLMELSFTTVCQAPLHD